MLAKHHGKSGNLHLRANWPSWSEHFASEKYRSCLTLFSWCLEILKEGTFL